MYHCRPRHQNQNQNQNGIYCQVGLHLLLLFYLVILQTLLSKATYKDVYTFYIFYIYTDGTLHIRSNYVFSVLLIYASTGNRTSNLLITKRLLYHCTTVAPPYEIRVLAYVSHGSLLQHLPTILSYLFTCLLSEASFGSMKSDIEIDCIIISVPTNAETKPKPLVVAL